MCDHDDDVRLPQFMRNATPVDGHQRLGVLVHAQELGLSHGTLKANPEAVTCLTNLTALTAPRNRLQGVLPQISQLTKLRMVNLTNQDNNWCDTACTCGKYDDVQMLVLY